MHRPSAAPFRDAPTWVLLVCLAITAFGLLHSNVLNERLWQPSLLTQTLVLFAAVGVTAVTAVGMAIKYGFKPEFLLTLVLIGVAAVLCGPAATLIVLVFLVSSWCLGSIVLSRVRAEISDATPIVTTIVGWSLFTILFAIMAPLPYNTTATHVAILAVPMLVAAAMPQLRVAFNSGLSQSFPIAKRGERQQPISYLVGLIACVLVLAFHLAMVALPERYYDAMAMHLYIPSFVSAHRAWSYDAGNYAFAYTPIGADMLYTHMFLLQGEPAARLLNFTAFAFTCVVLFRIAAEACSRAASVWMVALFVSVPLTVIESSTLFTENIITLFITTTALVLVACSFRVQLVHYLAILILMAGGSVVKLHGAIAALLFGGAGAVLYVRHARTPVRWARFLALSAAIGTVALWPYLYAWVKTSNPVLPLFNHLFKSPFFPAVEFVDPRWVGKLSPQVLYDATFATSGFVEGYNGALGFAFLIFLAAGFTAALVRRDRIVLFCGGSGLALIALLSVKTQYVRYLLIFCPLLMVVVAFAIDHLRRVTFMRIPVALIVLATLFLNIYKIPAGGWIIGVSDLRACCSENLRRQTELGQAPERIVNRIVNNVAGPTARVLYIGNPYGGLLHGTAIYSAWYNTRYATAFAGASTEEDFKALVTALAPTHVVIAPADPTALGKLAASYLSAHAALLTQVGPLALYRM